MSFVATVTASMLKPKISPAANVVVHPVRFVDRIALPVVSAGFVPMIVFVTVGNAVPVAIFQTSIVQVGEEPTAVIDQPVIVPDSWTVKYPVTPVGITDPAPSVVNPNECPSAHVLSMLICCAFPAMVNVTAVAVGVGVGVGVNVALGVAVGVAVGVATAIVTVSVEAFVVTIIALPAAKFSVSASLSATTLL